jgi:hypothetical protein
LIARRSATLFGRHAADDRVVHLVKRHREIGSDRAVDLHAAAR